MERVMRHESLLSSEFLLKWGAYSLLTTEDTLVFSVKYHSGKVSKPLYMAVKIERYLNIWEDVWYKVSVGKRSRAVGADGLPQFKSELSTSGVAVEDVEECVGDFLLDRAMGW